MRKLALLTTLALTACAGPALPQTGAPVVAETPPAPRWVTLTEQPGVTLARQGRGVLITSADPAHPARIRIDLADGRHPEWAGGSAGLVLPAAGLTLDSSEPMQVSVWTGAAWAEIVRWQ